MADAIFAASPCASTCMYITGAMRWLCSAVTCTPPWRSVRILPPASIAMMVAWSPTAVGAARMALAIICASVVLCLQVVATSLRWSVRYPYAVDLRSSRATPAPPLVMVGYSWRLALSTTFTGLLFGAASNAVWPVSLVMTVPFLLWSGIKLWRTSTRWADPVERSRVIATVAS